MMIGGVGVQDLELFRIVGGAVFRYPEWGDQKPMVAHHIQQRHGTDHGLKESRPLCQGCADEQSPIAATYDRQRSRLSPPIRDEPLRCRDEVIKDVLLALQHTGLVPFLAILTAAA